MRWGLIVRAERDRGIGIQSRAIYEHLHPDKVLVVDVGEFENRPTFPDDYPGATIVRMAADGTLLERKVRRWLNRLDVVLTVETFYDWQFCDWARSQSVRTVVQVNPEFYRHGMHRLPYPDGWWNPTTWRMEHLPPGTRHVPVPVDLTLFPERRRWRDRPAEPPRFLHPVGRWALYDRNGTEAFSRACYLAQGQLDATITSLEPLPPEVDPAGDWVTVKVGGVPNHWEQYDGYDVVVLPRKFGGLCLAAQEAMAAGCAVVMPDTPPNRDWPIVPVAATRGGRAPLPAGWMPICQVDAGVLANTLLLLRDDPGMLANARERSLEWAEENSWENLAPLYLDELERVLTHPLPPPSPERQHNPFLASDKR